MQKGSAEMIVLALLEVRPRHGYELAKLIEAQSESRLQFHVASLYPMLYRMERKGWIEAEWGLSESKREVKFYRLTAAGRARLKLELAQWSQFSAAVAKVLFAS